MRVSRVSEISPWESAATIGVVASPSAASRPARLAAALAGRLGAEPVVSSVSVASVASVAVAPAVVRRSNAVTQRRAVKNTTAMAMSDSMTCGMSTDQSLNPKARTTSAWIHISPGSLSMVIEVPSKEPHRYAFQLLDMEYTAGL